MTVRTKRDLATRFLGASVLALCAASATSVARAQESATPLEEISVQGEGRGETAEGPVDGYVATRSASGTKTDTPLIETPRSVSVVTRDEIEDRGATTLQEALAYTPGVASFSSGRSLVLDEFIIRGFDTATGDQGQLRDGMKLQANVYDGAQEPYGLERVEVVKGPASILYGQLGPGGIVNSISKRPTFSPQGEINLTGGSFDNKQVSADVSGPIGGENSDWAFRVTGLLRDADTWMDFIPDDKRYIAPALTWKPSDQTSLTVLGFYQEVRTRFKAPMDADGTVFRVPGIGRIPRDFFIGDKDFDKYNIDSGAITYLFEHDFENGLKLNSRARYFESKADWNYLRFLEFDPADPSLINRLVSKRFEHSKVWTADNNLQYKFETGPIEHTAVVGVDYARSTYDTHRFQRGLVDPIDLDDPDHNQPIAIDENSDSGFERKINQVGVYFQDQMKIAEKFVFLAGGRQDWARTEAYSYRPAVGGGIVGELPKQKDQDFSGQLGFIYLAPNGFAPYVSYSESFSPVVAVFQGLEESKPTTGKQYEGGIRWQAPDENTTVTGSIYRIDQKNVVTANAAGDPRQSGLVRSKGFELEAKSRWNGWQLIASYAYTDAKTIKDEFEPLIGEQVALVPLHQASVWATYDLTAAGVPGLTLGAGVRYFGKTNIPPDEFAPTPNGLPNGGSKVPGYVMVDALARMDLGKLNPSMQGFSAQINAKNLFDKKTYSCTSGFAACNYGQPRTILATVSYKW